LITELLNTSENLQGPSPKDTRGPKASYRAGGGSCRYLDSSAARLANRGRIRLASLTYRFAEPPGHSACGT
jgi:hypothetical protein